MLVLIVEDEPVIALEIETIVLDRLPDADVVFATSVCQALTKIDDATGLAFLDIDVTDGKTFPLAMALREKNIPFVFVSGADARETPPVLADAGFVPKPFSPLDIIRTIDAMVADDDRRNRP